MTNRTFENHSSFKKFKNINVIKWEKISKELDKFDILINATSLGLKIRENLNSNFTNFKKNMIYIDTIYNPKQTKLIQYFKTKNIKPLMVYICLFIKDKKLFIYGTRLIQK